MVVFSLFSEFMVIEMKLKRHNTEIIVETSLEAKQSGRSVATSNKYPIVLSYPYGARARFRGS